MAADPEKEALRRKNLAEVKYKKSNLKSALRHAEVAHRLWPWLEGIASMHTAFQILNAASLSSAGTEPDWYKILQVEPFSNFNTIKKQFRKLALVLHPDKNPYLGCEEAFKLVNEGFRVFEDKIRRKEYDRKLRNLIQEERINDLGEDEAELETFWTACSRCKLLHKFERKYLGHNLVCPSCKKSFKAVEVGADGEEESNSDDDVRLSDMILKKKKIDDDGNDERLCDMISKKKKKIDDERLCDMILKRKEGSGDGAVPEKEMVDGEISAVAKGKGGSGESSLRKGQKGSNERRGSEELSRKMSNGDLEGKGSGETIGSEPSGGRLKRRTSSVEEVFARSSASVVEDGEKEKISELIMVDDGEESMTLAEMQSEAKRKLNQREAKLKEKEMDKYGGEKENKRAKRGALMSRILEIEKEEALEDGTDVEIENQEDSQSSSSEEYADSESSEESLELEVETRRVGKKNGHFEIARQGTSENKLHFVIKRRHSSPSGDFLNMAPGDSYFFDFEKNRVETSFKKGQVWATYDDDRMPRRYGLVDEVVSVNPLEVKVNWLDLQNNSDERRLIRQEEMESRISCGTFKVTPNTSFHSLDIFSHIMDCERAAKELYRIYPKKGSIWALYNEAAPTSERTNLYLSNGEKHCYHIIVSLTTYDEIHGLSIGYLEKVDGFDTTFRRQEIGSHAVRYLGKDDLRLFSHQIPARKLSGDDVPDHLKDCWVLDRASLPSDLHPTILSLT